MSDGPSTTVECPVCEEEFDPSAAGGWCTNSDCGEWQYIGNEVPDPAETPSTPDGGTTASSSSDEADEDADDEPELDLEDPSEADEADEAADADDDADAEAAEDESGFEFDEPAADADDDADAETAEDDGTTTCPSCDSEVEPDANFCPECGADVDADASSTLEDCPSCGTNVDEDDSFCANCGEDLDVARAGPTGDGAAAPAEPESLVLEARGEQITVADGDTVGREARRILTDTGGDEDDAVLIHREHVRFVFEDGDFYVVDLGDNPTAVNGHQLSKGDREAIGPGDELALSDVVTLSVDAP